MIKLYVFYSYPHQKYVIKYLTGYLDKEIGYTTTYNEELVQILYVNSDYTCDSLFTAPKKRAIEKIKYRYKRYLYLRKQNIILKNEYKERRKFLWKKLRQE